jgi:DNA-directed RNA polymerase subunit RPC12/RpoP
MPYWALHCEKCRRKFDHAEIADSVENFYLAPKPPFPPGGSEIECPNCHHKAIYQRVELTYHASPDATLYRRS